jgi:sugar-specific transcriptional regulator TrmB
MFEKYLEDLGLSEKEAKVYLSLLEVDNDSVLDLAEKTKINRTTIYPVLESLSKKGLISEVKVDKKVRFQAEPPERLETYVERQKIVLEEHAKRLKDVIPQLKSVQRETGERPVVKLYDGKEGIISSLEDFFETKDKGGEAYFLYSRDLIDDLVPEEQRKKYKNIRVSKNIRSKTIYSYSKGDIAEDNTADRIRVDGNKYPFLCDIVVYEDRVKITTLLKSNTAITIKSHDLAETMKSMLKLIRDSLEK